MHDFDYVTPKGLGEASALLRKHGPRAALKAGGVDLVDLMKEGIAAPSVVVNLLSLPGLAAISEDPEKGLAIGSLVTLDAIATHPAVTARYPVLARAAGEAATPQIRNVATLGGNLCQRPRCWYFRSADFHCLKKGGDTCFAVEGDNRYHAIFGDGPCHIVSPSSTGLALVALGGSVDVVGENGERSVPAETFFSMPDKDIARENTLASGEIVRGARIPPPEKGTVSSYLKIREKEAFDWPIAEAAVVMTKDGAGVVRAARVTLGAVAPVPWRASGAEKALIGRPVGEKAAAEAAAAALAGAKPMSGNRYKVALLEEVVRRAILQAR